MDRLDPTVTNAIIDRKDKRTVLLAIGTALAFGTVISAMAIYEHLLRRLKESNLD